jgi:hypothetical protein
MLDDIDEDINAGVFPCYALSLYSPWVWAILHGGKDIENRSWKPPADMVGKWFWLHASVSEGRAHLLRELDEMANILALGNYGRRPPTLAECDRMRGQIVGRVKLLEVVTESSSKWFGGPYGLKLDPLNSYILHPTVAVNGRQRFWRVPHDALRRLAVLSAGTSFT